MFRLFSDLSVIAALEQIKAWEVENIAASLSTINSKTATHLEQLGFQLPNVAQWCPHMFGAQFPDLISFCYSPRYVYPSRVRSSSSMK